MMLGSQDYSCMRIHNLQCVTLVVAFGLRSDPFICYMAFCHTEDA